MRRLFSIEPVGILKACTIHVRMNSARITAMTIDSKYSRSGRLANHLPLRRRHDSVPKPILRTARKASCGISTLDRPSSSGACLPSVSRAVFVFE